MFRIKYTVVLVLWFYANYTFADTKTQEIKNRQLEDFLSGYLVQIFTENNLVKALIYSKNNTRQSYYRSEVMDVCRKLNATLVDIESYEKQKIVESFLHQIPYNWFWLGGYRDSSSGKYKWVNSGNEFQYTNWPNGSPDSSQEYLYINSYNGKEEDGVWRTVSATAYYINLFCEITVN